MNSDVLITKCETFFNSVFCNLIHFETFFTWVPIMEIMIRKTAYTWMADESVPGMEIHPLSVKLVSSSEYEEKYILLKYMKILSYLSIYYRKRTYLASKVSSQQGKSQGWSNFWKSRIFVSTPHQEKCHWGLRTYEMATIALCSVWTRIWIW